MSPVGPSSTSRAGRERLSRTLVKILQALGRQDWLDALEPQTRAFNPLDLLSAREREAQVARPRRAPRRKVGRAMTYQPTDVIEVLAWGRRVGAVALDPETGWYAFAYTKEWVDKRHRNGPTAHGPARSRPTSSPNCGARPSTVCRRFSPTRYPISSATLLVEAWMAEQGVATADITPLDRLAYAAERAMGALEFRPPARGHGHRAPDGGPTGRPRAGRPDAPCAASSPATRRPMPPSSS